MIRLHVWTIVTDLCISAEAGRPAPAVVRRLLRLRQVRIYSGQSGCSHDVGYLVVATSLALMTGPSLAGQEVTIRDAKQLVGSLRSGGYVIVVRHGATFSDQADTDPFNFD